MFGKFRYDIRNSSVALTTLEQITGVAESVWDENLIHEREFQYIEDYVEAIVDKHGSFPISYKEFEFVYFHVTTSSNRCESIYQNGILDLRRSYECEESEIRRFLDEQGVFFDIENRKLIYRNEEFDITYGKCPYSGSREYKCWSIGRKLYYDYTTCGFLSVCERSPYGGQVHLRPEILWDIDNLLHLNLEEKWIQSHKAYEVVATVSGENIVYQGDDDQSDREKVINYITKAYMAAYYNTSEEVLLMKNGVMIPPESILEIRPLSHWR